jgi:hypothetical protein
VDQSANERKVELRFVGGEKQVPLDALVVTVTHGYGSEQKTFGPYRCDKAGSTTVSLKPGFYSLHLKSEKEVSYLPVEAAFSGRSRTTRPDLSLRIMGSDVEKWINGKRRDEGYEPASKEREHPRITYTLLAGCELVLRAVDAETGKGIAGASFYTENALGEDWAHQINGENLGAKIVSKGKERDAANTTDKDGNFKRYIGANAGYKYSVEFAPDGYELVEPRAEVEIDVTYGKARAEQVFKFRKKR